MIYLQLPCDWLVGYLVEFKSKSNSVLIQVDLFCSSFLRLLTESLAAANHMQVICSFQLAKASHVRCHFLTQLFVFSHFWEQPGNMIALLCRPLRLCVLFFVFYFFCFDLARNQTHDLQVTSPPINQRHAGRCTWAGLFKLAGHQFYVQIHHDDRGWVHHYKAEAFCKITYGRGWNLEISSRFLKLRLNFLPE